MKIGELFQNKTVLSFEVFPPKRDGSLDSIYSTAQALSKLEPDYISVTYGAGGGAANGATTVAVASWIKNHCGIESVAHLPGMYLSKEEAGEQLSRLREQGIENVLALRGDQVEGHPPKGAFPHASDLAAYIKAAGGFHIMGACYPEGHGESGGIVRDVQNVKRKVDAGADHLVTQLFFDNTAFYSFRERAAIADIHVPIQAGIMPAVNKRQIERMVSLCGVALPKKFTKVMERYEDNALALRDAGIAYAVDQIVDLIAQGVDGIHLYTMNQPLIATRIYDAIYSMMAS